MLLLVVPPTYGMYSVCASVNDVQIVKVPLDVEQGRFLPHMDQVHLSTPNPLAGALLLKIFFSGQICNHVSSAENPPKLVFLTSPGNPTGTVIPPNTIRPLLEHPTWKGLVVVDEGKQLC